MGLLDTHALHALLEHVTVDRVAIAEEVGRRGVVSGKASTICWAVQRAVGCSVTLK